MSNIAEVIQAYAEGAVKVAAKTYHVKLDFSEESLKTTEKIFNSLHREATRNSFIKLFIRGLTEKQISSAALMLGVYIGEVIRRIHGGEWIEEEPAGSGEFALKIGSARLRPIPKAYKRIVNGPGDDIWSFYQTITKELKTGNLSNADY
jgi:hypothetical protein